MVECSPTNLRKNFRVQTICVYYLFTHRTCKSRLVGCNGNTFSRIYQRRIANILLALRNWQYLKNVRRNSEPVSFLEGWRFENQTFSQTISKKTLTRASLDFEIPPVIQNFTLSSRTQAVQQSKLLKCFYSYDTKRKIENKMLRNHEWLDCAFLGTLVARQLTTRSRHVSEDLERPSKNAI